MTLSPISREDDLLVRGLSLGAKHTALFDDAGECSFASLDRNISQMEEGIRSRGLRAGHRLAIVLPAGRAMLALLIASLRCEMLVTVLSPSLGPAARLSRLAIFRPDWLVTDESELSSEEPLSTLGAPGDQGGRLVLWTSGSTGLPRGVVLDWRGVLWNARTNAVALGLREGDRALVLLDGTYCYALVHQILSHVIVGASAAVPPQPAWLEATGRFIDRWRATTLAVVPSVLRALLGLPRIIGALRSLRMITVGGAAADEQLLQTAQDALPGVDLVVTYGLTEAGPRVCTRLCRPGEVMEFGTVGWPLPGIGISTAYDGELLVQSPSARVGELTERGFVPAPACLATGDIGVVAPDGAVRILGRKKLMIHRGGAKLAPGEIEQVIRKCPGVANVRVVAIPHRRLGEVPKAYVLPEPGARPSTVELARCCMEQLGLPWVPASFEVVSELPLAGRSWKEASLGDAVAAQHDY